MNRDDRRNNLEYRFDHLYTEVGRANHDPCVYCGVISSGYDHVPPLAALEKLDAVDVSCERLRKYTACRECNGWLGSTLLPTLLERRRKCKDHMRRKYAHFLRMPAWSEDELAELDPALADDVRRSAMYADHVKARLGWGR